ncbi:hypothetical protein F5972_07580 [Microbispora cellulosiformans]|uniref:Uncharacterized protein n=1 Tax=Microbispora cellulosiformans TaxID=2614688 RepID=A0A5J5K846_9ACTN|nr:hypothetical protein F5972_07580 [Microbispora cellulosiformans]
MHDDPQVGSRSSGRPTSERGLRSRDHLRGQTGADRRGSEQARGCSDGAEDLLGGAASADATRPCRRTRATPCRRSTRRKCRQLDDILRAATWPNVIPGPPPDSRCSWRPGRRLLGAEFRRQGPGCREPGTYPSVAGFAAGSVNARERVLRKPTPLFDASYGTIRLLGLLAMLYGPDLPPPTCAKAVLRRIGW